MIFTFRWLYMNGYKLMNIIFHFCHPPYFTKWLVIFFHTKTCESLFCVSTDIGVLRYIVVIFLLFSINYHIFTWKHAKWRRRHRVSGNIFWNAFACIFSPPYQCWLLFLVNFFSLTQNVLFFFLLFSLLSPRSNSKFFFFFLLLSLFFFLNRLTSTQVLHLYWQKQTC